MTGEAFRVDAHEDRLSVRHVAHRECDVLGLGVAHARAITVAGELTVLRRQLRGCDTIDIPLPHHPPSHPLLNLFLRPTRAPGTTLFIGLAGHRRIRTWPF